MWSRAIALDTLLPERSKALGHGAVRQQYLTLILEAAAFEKNAPDGAIAKQSAYVCGAERGAGHGIANLRDECVSCQWRIVPDKALVLGGHPD